MTSDPAHSIPAGLDAGAQGASAAGSVPELDALARLLIERREAQGLSVTDLAQRLHMGLEQLRAFEQADLEQLPEPVFVIAHARRVADALGLDISTQIEALRANPAFMAGRPALKAEVFQDAVTRQRQSRPVEPLTPFPTTPRDNGAAWRPLAWVLLLAALGSGGTWLWQNRQLAEPLRARTAAQVARLLPAPSAAEAPAASARPPLVAPKPKPKPQPAELRLSASQPSWLVVRPLGGGPSLFRGRLIGQRRFPLGAGLMVRAGRPDLVLASLGPAAGKPLGTISQIRWVSFKPPLNTPATTKPQSAPKPPASAQPGPGPTAVKPAAPQP